MRKIGGYKMDRKYERRVTKYSYRITQNKPPINSFTHQPILFFMQNEPNFTTNAPTKHEKYANFTPTFHSLLHLLTNITRTFTQKSKKMREFCHFLTLTHLTPYTTKTYIKFYLPKAVSPQNTLQERNLPAVFLAEKNAKQTQFHKYIIYAPKNNKSISAQGRIHDDIRNTRLFMQNKPNSCNTQYSRRNTKICKTNPIFDETNVSPYIQRVYGNE